MLTDEAEIDSLLAAALRGEGPAWPDDQPAPRGVERILYHGISGLIVERMREFEDWPGLLLEQVHTQAISQAMWELRHKPLLADVLAAFAEAGITALLLKGSALAYDLYPAPASRSRGDSDLLVAPADLNRARLALGRLGFERTADNSMVADLLVLQEVWSAPGDGGNRHYVDLHWQLLNAFALREVMEFETCAANPLPLPRLGPGAIAMSRVCTLLHTCIHRAMHITNPYFVDGVTYYGGERLIWANDIHLLASALSDAEWGNFAALALEQGVGKVALNGLETAQRTLNTAIPTRVRERLCRADDEAASTYLLAAGQMRRSWADLLAVGGWRRKLAYAKARALPSTLFIRGKYPDMRGRPLAALYARRAIDLPKPRPGQRKRR